MNFLTALFVIGTLFAAVAWQAGLWVHILAAL